MACKCSPSLVRLMADFAARGHVNSGCCGDAAHQARKSDHNANSSGFAHAQDIHELADHDMKPYIDFIMANPSLFPQVKYLIYEGRMYYPHDGARRAGSYAYTGPNAHAHHLHVSIFDSATNYAGGWFVATAYGEHPGPAPIQEAEVAYESITVPAGEQRLLSWPIVGLNGIKRAYLVLGSVNEGTTAYVVIGNEQGESRNEDDVAVKKGGRAYTVALGRDDNYALVINKGKQQLLAYTEAWPD